MPVNVKYKNSNGVTSLPVIRRLVAEYGLDAAAEEQIVLRLVTDYPPRVELGWVSTDNMRKNIRKIQGRPRERSLGRGQGPCLEDSKGEAG